MLTTYPFPRNAVDAVEGDYVNLHVTADLDLAGIYGNLADKPGGEDGDSGKPEAPDLPDLPDVPDVPDVPGLPSPTALPDAPDTPVEPPAPRDADPLCPPVCTAAHGPLPDSRRLPPGIDLALAELMLKGIQP
jgi:phospholipid/cholesterol/gamma-HCH transport system substrate-binding protein